MSTDEILLGVGLTIALAVGSQILATRLHLPAIIVLLPVGFLAGAVTDVVNPENLLGPAFEPLVGLAVAVILYDAGLGLDLRKLTGHARRVVIRLVVLGVPITFILAALVAVPVLALSRDAALMIGAIVVVSGPLVVGPLLDFVRPTDRVRRILAWEGSVIDPVGAILGAVVFTFITAQHADDRGPFAEFVVSIGVGLFGGVVGTAVLWFLLRRLQLGEVLGTAAQLAAVVAIAAWCDVIRDDAGLMSAIVMGVTAANMREFDMPARRPFFETMVQLILGLLFVSISATVAPASLRHVILPTLVLVAFLVLIVRPLVAFLSTLGTELSRPERRFVGWMAPRGIVAAATASTFALTLTQRGVGGAEKILPATFLIIVATVTLYGLTAAPVARRLGVLRPARSRPLLVGGDAFVLDLAKALRQCGLEVLLWSGDDESRERIRAAGLDLAPGELLAAATTGADMEGVTTVLLLTNEDDFNALAATLLEDAVDGPVYRIAPPSGSHGVVAPYSAGKVLFPAINRSYVESRYAAGATVVTRYGAGVRDGEEVLFVVRPDGSLMPGTAGPPTPGDQVIILSRNP